MQTSTVGNDGLNNEDDINRDFYNTQKPYLFNIN